MTSLARPSSAQPLAYGWLGLILVIAGWFAYRNHFIQDDAYIAFRYAHYFAQGQGLVWYPGSDELGYTSFLFTLAVGLLLKLGLSAETAAFALSIPAYFGAIIVTFLIGRRLSDNLLVPVLAAFSLATNMTFAGYATGGLETSLHIFLVLLAYHAFLLWRDTPQVNHLARLGVVSALALLTRLDSALLLFPLYVMLFLSLAGKAYQEKKPANLWMPLLLAAGIPTLAVALLLIVNAMVYGHALPNAFYVKIDDRWHTHEGFGYLLHYSRSRGHVPLALLVLLLFSLSRRDFTLSVSRDRLLLLAPAVIWFFYVLNIGGDFMEFRFVLPMMPFFALFITMSLLESGPLLFKRMDLVLVILIVFAAISQRQYFRPGANKSGTIESMHTLSTWISDMPVGWVTVGKTLHTLLYTGQPTDPKIAVAPAGAIPYYSQLPALDMLGLNTRDVLNAGEIKQRAGHRYKASLNYMRQSGVNLVIDHPLYVCLQPGERKYSCAPTPVPLEPIPYEQANVVFIPMVNDCYMIAYYLTPHPELDVLIQQDKIYSHEKMQGRVSCKKWLPGYFERPAAAAGK